jgi:hypothetical protein
MAQPIDEWKPGRAGVYGLFQPGLYYMLDYPVNVRMEPNLNSEIVGKLNLHEQIEILEPSLYVQKIEDIWSDWYKIKYKNSTGYIWGGYIAYKSLIVDIDGNGVTDYFYFRVRDVAHFHAIIDTWQDIIIYINNEKIETNIFYPRICSGVNFIAGTDEIVVADSGFSYPLKILNKENLKNDNVLIAICEDDGRVYQINIFELNKYRRMTLVQHFEEESQGD